VEQRCQQWVSQYHRQEIRTGTWDGNNEAFRKHFLQKPASKYVGQSWGQKAAYIFVSPFQTILSKISQEKPFLLNSRGNKTNKSRKLATFGLCTVVCQSLIRGPQEERWAWHNGHDDCPHDGPDLPRASASRLVQCVSRKSYCLAGSEH
jgi:hypothetical protein